MVTNYRLSYVSTGYSAQFCMHLFLASYAGGREIPMQMPGVVCREVKFGALTAVTSQCLQWVDILTAVLLMECKQHLQHLQNVYAILSTHWLMCSIKKKEREKECHGPRVSPADPTLGDMFCFLLPVSLSSAGAVLITGSRPWPKPLCSVTTPADDPQYS